MASTQASPANNPKTMSSRLLTMKFMQRAAASPLSSPRTPDSHHSAKRQRLSNGIGSPVTPSVDAAAIQAALAVEEAKHQAALDRQRAASQETKWVLSCMDENKGDKEGEQGTKIASIGYGEIDIKPEDDQGASEPWSPAMVGRRSFGRFNRRLEKQQHQFDNPSPQQQNSSGEDDDSSEDSGEVTEDENETADTTYSADRESARRVKVEHQARNFQRGKKPYNASRAERANKPGRMSSISAGGAGGRGRTR